LDSWVSFDLPVASRDPWLPERSVFRGSAQDTGPGRRFSTDVYFLQHSEDGGFFPSSKRGVSAAGNSMTWEVCDDIL
jgi:hypothetical protein